MWVTLRREGGETRSDYQCPDCERPHGPLQPRQEPAGEERAHMTKSLLSTDQLRQQIGVRLRQRRLPAITVGVYKTRQGTGRPCVVCRREIGRRQTEYELDDAGGALIAHESCYTLWREESVSYHRDSREK